MKCKECPYFHIRQRPIRGFDFGMAECKLFDLVVDFRTMTKINSLECVNYNKETQRAIELSSSIIGLSNAMNKERGVQK